MRGLVGGRNCYLGRAAGPRARRRPRCALENEPASSAVAAPLQQVLLLLRLHARAHALGDHHRAGAPAPPAARRPPSRQWPSSSTHTHRRGKRVMLDCGIHPGYSGLGSLPFLDEVELDTLDAALITHFHLDHCAAVPYLIGKTNFKVRRGRWPRGGCSLGMRAHAEGGECVTNVQQLAGRRSRARSRWRELWILTGVAAAAAGDPTSSEGSTPRRPHHKHKARPTPPLLRTRRAASS